MKLERRSDLPVGGVSERRVAVVRACFNSQITQSLFDHAYATLTAAGVGEILVAEVAGAVELPLAAQKMFKDEKVDGVVALGAVLRGETAHFDHVCSMCAQGLMQVQLKFHKPIAFGVLTVDTLEQALARSGEEGNKGRDSALCLMEMMHLMCQRQL